MANTELDLAQLERRILAGERCISRQREILNRQLAARLPAEGALQRLAEFEATLSQLRRARFHLREQLAAATTRRLIEAFWSLPEKQRRRSIAAARTVNRDDDTNGGALRLS